MTSETELTGLTLPELRRELLRLENQRDRLVKEFPHLAQLSDTPSVISQYAVGNGTPERVLFYDLKRRIRLLKVELLQRDEALDEPSAEACDDPPQAQAVAPSDATRHAKRVKKTDLSRYLEQARLTDKQYECASLRWEYGLSVSQIARELKIHRKTVDQHVESAQSKMRSTGLYEKLKRRLARGQPEG